MDVIVENAVKTFWREDGPVFRLAIKRVNFEVGNLVYIMGHNGSGKSILARLVAGEIDADQNVPFVVRYGPGFSQAGILRQGVDQNLAIDLRVIENVAIGSDALAMHEKIFPKKAGKRLATALTRFPLIHEKRHDFVRTLSLGQRQALAFAVVAARRFSLLFLDEFLSATDAHTSRLLQKEAQRYAEETPASVCVISHDVVQALDKADRIIIMKGGGIVKDCRRGEADWSESGLLPLLSSSGGGN